MCFLWVETVLEGGHCGNYYEVYHFIDEILTDYNLVIPGSDVNKLIWSVVPRGNYYYFVRDDDPTISFVGKPQFRDSW